MSSGWPTAYDDIKGVRPLEPCYRVTSTTQPDDPVWDGFLERTNLGQFQQTSGWAIVKAADGWKLARSVVARSGAIIGGGQLLWKQKGLFRIGYVTKGPVVAAQDAGVEDLVLDGVLALARQLRLAALIVQPPDLSAKSPGVLSRRGFQQESLMGVVNATLLADLAAGMPAVEARMRQRELRKTRQARRRGVTVREGEREHLPAFFDLMCLTCDRQGNVHPNPGSAQAFQRIWDLFRPAGCRLTLAEAEGKIVAGLFCFSMGRTLTLWKKGSLPEALALQPISLLYHEAMTWGAGRGLATCDFGGLRSDIAATLLRGGALDEEQMRSRDFFNLGYGGQPTPLPPAMIHFPNPLFRLGYAGIAKFPWLRRAAKRMAG